MSLTVEEKQKLLEINNLKDRALETLRHMNTEMQKLTLRNDIQNKVHSDMSHALWLNQFSCEFAGYPPLALPQEHMKQT